MERKKDYTKLKAWTFILSVAIALIYIVSTFLFISNEN